jgi:hypothetical protein
MNVNDIDLMIPEHKKSFLKIGSILKKKKIKFDYYPKWETMIIQKGKLKIEVDSVGLDNEGFDEITLFSKEYDLIDFYGMKVKLFKFEHLEKAYIRAYFRSTDNKDKIMDKIERLEKFLGRKLKNTLSVIKVKNKDLSKSQKEIINQARVSEWGKEYEKDFSKDYEPETIWFFVKNKGEVVALGGIRPIELNYLRKKYKIGGICSTISLIKGKGYGKILISFMKEYSYKTGKTILGFTTQTEFFKKVGLKIEKNFVKRFVYVKPDGEEVFDDVGDGIYYEGRDKIISKILKTKKPVYIRVLHW